MYISLELTSHAKLKLYFINRHHDEAVYQHFIEIMTQQSSDS